jgi:rhodanese-related sulfurtransferase
MWPFTSTPTPSVSVTDAAQKVQGANVAFIDVRTPAEYEAGHAKGAQNYPLGTLDASQIEKLQKYAEVYVICQSGNRSSSATRALVSGSVNAFNVNGGTSAWRAAGLPLS